MLEQITPQTPEQTLQLKAAQLALEGRFKDTVSVMLESLGMDSSAIPQWALPGPMTEKSCGLKEPIGNIFLYRRLNKETHGQIAACILRGDYGVAANLMIEKEMAPILARQLDQLPEDLEDMRQYLEKHPQLTVANEPFLPSWAR